MKRQSHETPPSSHTQGTLRGFTLIELLVVVAIIGIIAAIAIPNLLRSRMSSNETAAISGCRTLTAGDVDYHNNHHPHGFAYSLEALATGQGAGGVAYIDPVLGKGIKSGYTFSIVNGNLVGGGYQAWSGAAWPISYKSTGVRSFYCDETGVVRGSDVGGTVGGVSMPAVD